MIVLIKKIKSLVLSLFLFFPFLTSCGGSPSDNLKTEWQFISARDSNSSLEKPLIYRGLVPNHWTRKDPSPEESILDTTKSNCEFYIQDEDESIRITVHTFPILDSASRIPPQAQVFRWKKQFEYLDPLALYVSHESHGGFYGLFFESEGLIQEKPIKVMGWTMQLATVYERLLAQENTPKSQLKRADYTIKASGSPKIMQNYKDEITAFANSFELIEELPKPL